MNILDLSTVVWLHLKRLRNIRKQLHSWLLLLWKCDSWTWGFCTCKMVLLTKQYCTMLLFFIANTSFISHFSDKGKSPESELWLVFPQSYGFFLGVMRGGQGRGRWRGRMRNWGWRGRVDGWMDGRRTGVMPQGAAGWGSEGESARLKMMN